jgi:hypothetical protein
MRRHVRIVSLNGEPITETRMRLPFYGAICAATLLSFTHLPTTAPGEACYVAELAVIVDDVADFKYHRVVVSGIRRFEATRDVAGNCEPRDAMAVNAMKRAVEQRLDSVRVAPRQMRTTIALQHTSLDFIKSQIVRFATLAREHAGTFKRVEVVSVNVPGAPRSEELPLPRLATSDADAAACASDNAGLVRAGATFLWAC